MTRPAFETARLIAQPVTREHASAMLRVLADPSLYSFLDGAPPALDALVRHYTYLESGKSPDGEEHWLTWILQLREGAREPIGYVQATVREPQSVHIAYVLAPQHWREGYAREAMSALIDLVVERYAVERVIAEMDTRNAASIALASTLGMVHESTRTGAGMIRGVASDEHTYAISAERWRAERAMEWLWHVDEHDEPIGRVERNDAHARAIRHRSGIVFLMDAQGRVYLVARAPSKRIFPNCNDSSASFHVAYGESYLAAARREALEELGLDKPLQRIGKFRHDDPPEHQFVEVFVMTHADEPIVLDPSEGTSGAFYDLSEAARMVREEPCTPWLREGLPLLIAHARSPS